MKTETRIQKVTLALLAAGFILCGCGRLNPLGIVADQREDPPWVKRDEQGRIRSIGRPAPGPRQGGDALLIDTPKRKNEEMP